MLIIAEVELSDQQAGYYMSSAVHRADSAAGL